MDINAIVEAYKAKKITADEANKALADAGANFRFDPDKAGRGWTEAEMAAGFNPGKPPWKCRTSRTCPVGRSWQA